MKKLLIFLLLIFPLSLTAQAKHKVMLQVLGSGGPEMNDKRASSSYIIWIDGKSRILVDFGGGASLRFEESGAQIEDLDVILLTHLHIDHTSDLPALLKAGFFLSGKKSISLYGPYGNSLMPDTESFLYRLFEDGKGAWEYMGDHLDGRADLQIVPHTIEYSKEPVVLFNENNISVEAVAVHHGDIPAIAYRINIADKSITFSGDMNGELHTLEKLAKDTDILVMHNAVPQKTSNTAASLHMIPKVIGEIAQKANPKTVILSHRMKRTSDKELETISEIRKNYKGKVKFADDLSTFLVL